jgi:hypothetical protein
MIVLVYSYTNIWQTSVFITIDSSVAFFSTMMKMIAQNPRPFWVDNGIVPLNCKTGLGFPSGHMFCLVPSYLVFFEIMMLRFTGAADKPVELVDTNSLEPNNRPVVSSKYTSLGFIIGYTCLGIFFALTCLCRMALGVHTLDQVLMGGLFGFLSYYFFFYVMEVDYEDYSVMKQAYFNKGVLNKFIFYYIIIFLFGIIGYILIPQRQFSPEIIAKLTACGAKGLSSFTRNYLNCGGYFAILGILLATIIDCKYRYDDWNEYEIDNLSITASNSEEIVREKNKERTYANWNHTSTGVSLSRTLAACFLIKVIEYLLTHIITVLNFIHPSSNVAYIIIFGKAIPAFVLTFVTPFVVKDLARTVNLANEKVNRSDYIELRQDEVKKV